ncbi:MAG TPA: AAA family ATPase [Polyangiaceae bacterium]|jgi:chromosome partitioning protein|nr:AAA family ATPase [Polyangiaceae bacterium]
MTAPAKPTVMEGSLHDFSLADILQILSVSPEYTRIELQGEDRSPAGAIVLKSGNVVRSVSGADEGTDALFRLLQRRAGFFRVFRDEPLSEGEEPVGSVRHLLIEASAHADANEEVTHRNLGPRPSPTPSRRRPFPLPPPSRSLRPRSEPSAAPRPPRQKGTPSSKSGVHRAAGEGHVIAVASPKGGSGKTTVSLNLSLALARRGHRVVLIDGDVNGDVLSAVDARGTADVGVFDVLAGRATLESTIRQTVFDGLEVVPAVGRNIPEPELTFRDYGAQWRAVLRELSTRAPIVIVDTPAGMLGTTYQILGGTTHVIGVLQAEVIAQRSFKMFSHCIAALPSEQRPSVLGVFLNMLQLGHGASIKVLQQACDELPREWLFDTAIPRSGAFLDASAAGVPLHLYRRDHAPAVTSLFDTLAAEVVDRLSLSVPPWQQIQQRFLG